MTGGTRPRKPVVSGSSWVDDRNALLLTDLYELTMAQAYWSGGMQDRAVFSLFVRRLPEERNYLLACGLDPVLAYLEALHPSGEVLRFLRESGFEPLFVDWLADLRFTGDVWAVPEGTPVFAGEPILEVEAPLPEAQLVETFVLNQIHLQTVLASKAARVTAAAGGRPVVDFGLRRMQGADAGLKSARAFYIAGVDATSNVLAGYVYGIPVRGTMAHSYVQAHEDELAAFRAFVRSFPDSTLVVDTYDTVEGVRNVVRLSRELGDGFRVGGVRLDSGDLGALAREARAILDGAGLHAVQIFASGGLDEWEIRGLVERGAPIDGFGVGTSMGVSMDAPTLDMAYKLVSYAGRGRVKLSPGKHTLPGRKQVFRVDGPDGSARDVIALADEDVRGRPLLRKVMERGVRLPGGRESLETARERAAREVRALPERLRRLEAADPGYGVDVSAALAEERDRVERRITDATGERMT